MVVQTDPPPKPRKPCNIKQKRRRREEFESGIESSRWFYDPFGTWPSFGGCMPWMSPYLDVSIGAHGPGIREVSCGPSLCIDQCSQLGYLWIDRSSVKEEFVVRSSAVRSVVVSKSSSDVALVVGGVHGLALGRSASVEVNLPIVDHALRSVPVGHDDWQGNRADQFDDMLVRCYGYLGDGRQLFPPCTPLCNKFVGGKFHAGLDCLTYGPIRLRNIMIGKPAIVHGLHVGGVARFETRTFVYNLGDRKTNTRGSVVRVKGGHHEGRNYFALGCTLDPPFPVIAA